MNIFNALSQGYGSISETNYTSFLSFLLTDNNECKNYFFIEFLRSIENEADLSIINNILKIDQKTIRDISNAFRNEYQFTVEPEKSFTGIRTDIFIRIYDRTENEKDIMYFIIEAKISKSAVKINQLDEQIINFKNSEEYNKDAIIFPILICPDDNYYTKCFSQTLENVCCIKWLNSSGSITSSLRKLIELDHYAQIEPFDFSVLFILKSFIDFIETSFSKSLYINYSVSGIPEKDKTKFILNDKTYILRRFQNNMIRIYDDNENLQTSEVKPVLRDIIKEYNLEISLENKTTQMLGRDIITALNRRDSDNT